VLFFFIFLEEMSDGMGGDLVGSMASAWTGNGGKLSSSFYLYHGIMLFRRMDEIVVLSVLFYGIYYPF